ncbi:hypothetical protein [Caproicibacterium sp. BJN0003]|uniref:hypothetical protein n=1 Tax=Caproicibacterium sp. BJN0003 TaxID=2994078 RepID=UPI0022552CC8|nr:hypothetical protein [Caproicibacterium sp. BJN0003]UZT82147.1 hypothetical protein OP489_11875 [Caproicibacterium sp. BJN0003]
MYDILSVTKRTFAVKLHCKDEDGNDHATELEIFPPKLKALREIVACKNDISDMQEAVKKMLSNNKSKFVVPDEYIEEMNFDELSGLLTAYFQWVADTKKS